MADARVTWSSAQGYRRVLIAFKGSSKGLDLKLTVPAPLAVGVSLQLLLEIPRNYVVQVGQAWRFRGTFTRRPFAGDGNVKSQGADLRPLIELAEGTVKWVWAWTHDHGPRVLRREGADHVLAEVDPASAHVLRFVRVPLRSDVPAPVGGLGDSRKIYTVEHTVGIPSWHGTTPTAPPLWPFGIAPFGDVATGAVALAKFVDLSARPVIAPLLAGETTTAWRMDAYWSTDTMPSAAQALDHQPLVAWNRIARVHRGALVGVRSRTKPSALPDLKARKPGRQVWRSSYHLELQPGNTWRTARTRLRLATATPLAVTATFGDVSGRDDDGLRDHGGNPLERAYLLQPPSQNDWNPEIDDEIPRPKAIAVEGDDLTPSTHHVAFELHQDSTFADAVPAAAYRIGALDLRIGAPVTKSVAAVLATGRDWRNGAPGSVWMHVGPLQLRVDGVDPGAQDPTESEAQSPLSETASGLLIVRDDGTRDRAPRFIVTFDETSSATKEHELDVSLRQDPDQSNSPSAPKRVFVLDDHPFLVARVDLDTADVTSAQWKSIGIEGAAWSVVDGDAPARIQLPPQVVGEEMVKHYDDYKGFKHEPSTLRMKFAEPTRLEVDRSALDTAGAEPAWNLRRLFGWPGQRLAGSRLTRLQTELLYGITVSLEKPIEV
ncbi:MAG: hypothetical protein KC464_13095, partial [Myxococcales bacterium]|nr:hypothetical protein [Myxococcales bacterium]